jgi:hypothetical protein
MPQKVSWFLEDSVILARVWGTAPVEEMGEYDKVISNMLDSSQSPNVYLVFDGREAEGLPPLRAYQSFTFPKHPRLKAMIVFRSSNRFLNFIASAVTQLFSLRTYFANSIDEVLQLLQDLNPEFPDLTPYRHQLEEGENMESS